ncbi:hypothetical protein FACS1894199_14360 [Bacteroidia bacterium]|nr:hypothetical protein FACS1894199_14360 [Bacteroidia bacterium]
MKVAGGFGGGAGFGYTYFMTEQWGISTGLEFSLSSSTLTADKFSDDYTLAFPRAVGEDEKLKFTSEFEGYEEKQSATYLHIPLMLRFQTTGTHRFQMGAGLKVGFALSGSYDVAIKSLTTTGDFPKTALTVYDEAQHALTTYSNVTSSGDLSLGLSVALSMDVGMHWGLSDKLGLYTGVYLDYGVVNILPSPTAHLVGYDPDIAYDPTSTASPLPHNSALTTPLVDKANLFSVGVKVGVAF